MTGSFNLSGDSLVWTARGILKISELKEGDLILGIGRHGKPEWRSLKSTSFYKTTHLLSIFSNHNETRVFGNQKLSVLGGFKKAEKLEAYKDRFELCIKKSFFDEAFCGFSYETSKLTPSISYFLGLIKGCKIQGDKISFAANEIKKTNNVMKLFDSIHKDLAIRWKKLYWSQRGRKAIVISPDLLCTIDKLYTDWRKVPFIVRTSTLECLKRYTLGLIDAFSSDNNNTLLISTHEDQTNERRFILNVLSLFGVWPMKLEIIRSKKVNYVNITIKKDVSEQLSQNHRIESPTGIRFPYIKSIFKSPKSPIFTLEIEGINWNLCSDFLFFKS